MYLDVSIISIPTCIHIYQYFIYIYLSTDISTFFHVDMTLFNPVDIWYLSILLPLLNLDHKLFFFLIPAGVNLGCKYIYMGLKSELGTVQTGTGKVTRLGNSNVLRLPVSLRRVYSVPSRFIFLRCSWLVWCIFD